MKTFTVLAPVSIITRNSSRNFERTETEVPEAEIQMMVNQVWKCFKENPPAPIEEGEPHV